LSDKFWEGGPATDATTIVNSSAVQRAIGVLKSQNRAATFVDWKMQNLGGLLTGKPRALRSSRLQSRSVPRLQKYSDAKPALKNFKLIY
jgi:hypothetical protein